MSNLHELLKKAIVRENCDPRETFDAYFGECRKMFKFCVKPASQWTGQDVENYIWKVLHAGDYSRSSRKNYLCAMDVALPVRQTLVQPMQISFQN